MSDFPKFCSSGHAQISLADDTAVQGHLASAHATSKDQAAIRAAMTSQAAASGAAVVAPSDDDPYARWGLVQTGFSNLKAQDLSAATGFTVQQIQGFISHFGAMQNPPITVDLHAFTLEFFVFVLVTAASEETSSAGSFTLRSAINGDKMTITWSSFFSSASSYFSAVNLEAKPRKFMRTFESLFWRLWNDSSVKALDDIRKNGTKLSQAWDFPSGGKPKAYVVVPQLFQSQLTPAEAQLRIDTQATVTKEASQSDAAVYHGYDPQSRNLMLRAYKTSLMQRTLPGLEGAQKQAPNFQEIQRAVTRMSSARDPS